MGHGEGGTGGVALGTLNGDQLGLFVDGVTNALVVKGAVPQQIHLPVADTVLSKRTGTGTNTDDLLQSIIGQTHRAQQLVTGQQVGRQRDGQCVGTAGDVGTHQGGLRMEHIGIHLLKGITAQIVIAVAGGSCETGSRHPVLLHGGNDLGLVVFSDLVDLRKTVSQFLNGLLTPGVNRGGNAHGIVKL